MQPALEETIEGKVALPNVPSFFNMVNCWALAVETLLENLRLKSWTYEQPQIDALIPDSLPDAERPILKEILYSYCASSRLPQETGAINQRAPDPVLQNAPEWSGGVACWQHCVYTKARKDIDELLPVIGQQIKRDAQQRLQPLLERLHAYSIQLPQSVHLNGGLTAEMWRIRSKLYEALPHHDDPYRLFAISFKEGVKYRGWDALPDEKLAEELEKEQVALPIFEEHTGRKVMLPKKEPETVAEVIEEVKRKAERFSRGQSSGLRSIDGELILMPRTSTYAQGGQALRAACADEPNSPHPFFTRADGTKIYRPLTFKENLRARVNDFSTKHDASGAQRSLADRLRLFNRWLDSCTGAAYQAGTDKMKIIPLCEPLIMIAPGFSDNFLGVSYASLDGYELDRSRHPHSAQLAKDSVIADPYWLAAVEEDEDLLKEYADIVFALLLENYDLTNGMGFYPRSRTATDELRALFVHDLDDSSNAVGDDILYGDGSFLRVAPSSSSDAPAGRRA